MLTVDVNGGNKEKNTVPLEKAKENQKKTRRVLVLFSEMQRQQRRKMPHVSLLFST